MVAGMETNKENIKMMPNEAKYIVFLDRNSAVAPEIKNSKILCRCANNQNYVHTYFVHYYLV